MKIILLGDTNVKTTEHATEEFTMVCNQEKLVKVATCFKIRMDLVTYQSDIANNSISYLRLIRLVHLILTKWHCRALKFI